MIFLANCGLPVPIYTSQCFVFPEGRSSNACAVKTAQLQHRWMYSGCGNEWDDGM